MTTSRPDFLASDGSATGNRDQILDPVELLAIMGRDFVGFQDIDHTLRTGLARITRHLDAEGGALFLLDEGGQTLTCTCCVGATSIEGLKLLSNQGIVGRSMQNNVGELVRDVREDPGFFAGVDAQTGYTTRSVVCAPMSVRDERIGVIELVNKRGEDPRFSPEDLRMLETMASSAALAILNAQMAKVLVQQERMRRELELAAEIQRSLLPEPLGDAFALHGINIAAGAISGDFYDFFPLPDGRICFNLGDVSGKGMNAALLMAKTASLFRGLGKTIHSPGALLARINIEICETATRGMFVTMIGGVYDPVRGEVRLANAGHEPALLDRCGEGFEAFPADVPPLGIVVGDVDDHFPETVLRLDGGTLYLFSDGVTEGYLHDATTLGAEGLMAALGAGRALSAREQLNAVTGLFTKGGGPLRDDVTMLIIDDRVRHRTGAAAGQERGRAEDKGASDAPASHEDEAGADDELCAEDSFCADDRLCADDGGDGEERVSLSVASRPERLRLIRQVVSLAASESGCSEADRCDLVLAVDEACQNVIRHAYCCDPNGKIIVTICRRGDDLVVLVRDFAPPVDVETVRPRDLGDLRPGGLGTHLMRAVLDDVQFLPPPAGGGNLLKLVKKIRQGHQ